MSQRQEGPVSQDVQDPRRMRIENPHRKGPGIRRMRIGRFRSSLDGDVPEADDADDTATGTTDNESQKVRAAAVPRPVPTSALPTYIRTCSRAAGTPTMLHILLHFSALDHDPHPTPSRMHQLYHGAVRYPFSLWHDTAATRLFTVPFPGAYGWPCETRAIPSA